MKLFVLSVLASVLVSVGVFADPMNGKAAPDFSGVTMTGKTINLSDFKGKPVVLEWTNHECPYTRKHYSSGNMQKTQRAITEGGGVWISIVSAAPDSFGYASPQQAQELNTSRGSYADYVVLDTNLVIAKLYAAKTTPHMFMIDADGSLVYQGAIDDIPSVSPRSLDKATNLVLAAWDEYKAGTPVTEANTRPYGCAVKY